jgi:hypothetical protein
MIMDISASEILAIIYQTTRRHMPKDRDFDSYRRESPDCHVCYVDLKEVIRKIFGPKEDKINEQFKISYDNRHSDL